MSINPETVKHAARLSRIALDEDETDRMTRELNDILNFVEQLNEVDVSNVEPMLSAVPMNMKKRLDIVNEGGIASDIVANAPAVLENFFLAPRIVE